MIPFACARMRAVTSGRLLAARERKDIKLAHSQWNLNLDGLCDNVFDFSQHLELVLALDVFRVGDHHTGNETTQRCDTVSLSDTELAISAHSFRIGTNSQRKCRRG